MTRINFDDCAWTNCLCMSWTLTLARKDWFIYDPLHSSNFDFRSCTRRRSSCRSCCRGTTWTSIRDAKYIVAIVADWERGKPNWIVPPFRQGNCRLGMQLEFAIIIRLGASHSETRRLPSMQNPHTLLPKFFGMYMYMYNQKNIRLTAMNNLLPSNVKMHLKFDLKGSTYKRKVREELAMWFSFWSMVNSSIPVCTCIPGQQGGACQEVSHIQGPWLHGDVSRRSSAWTRDVSLQICVKKSRPITNKKFLHLNVSM